MLCVSILLHMAGSLGSSRSSRPSSAAKQGCSVLRPGWMPQAPAFGTTDTVAWPVCPALALGPVTVSQPISGACGATWG